LKLSEIWKWTNDFDWKLEGMKIVIK